MCSGKTIAWVDNGVWYQALWVQVAVQVWLCEIHTTFVTSINLYRCGEWYVNNAGLCIPTHINQFSLTSAALCYIPQCLHIGLIHAVSYKSISSGLGSHRSVTVCKLWVLQTLHDTTGCSLYAIQLVPKCWPILRPLASSRTYAAS